VGFWWGIFAYMGLAIRLGWGDFCRVGVYMRVDLKLCKHYFLTCNNEVRRKHFWEEFGGLDVTEILGVVGMDKQASGPIGFSRMLDRAVCDFRGERFRPFCIFEDDVKKYREFPEYVDIPDDADILYLGLSSYGISDFSHCYEMYYKGVDAGVVRVLNMLSLHGLMICSVRGLMALQKCFLEGYYTNQVWDILIAQLQPHYNMYALRVPLVYQCGELGGQEAPTKIELGGGERPDLPGHWVNRSNLSIMSCHPDCCSSL
jgi:hypothetical protein